MTSGRNHWLFKTEPSCFSFSDLELSADRTAHWDGVRNYQARNFLRDEVKLGDGVLIYHSSIPKPAVVGIAVVVREGYGDWTACDPESEHFDPKSSRENPIWYMVDVQSVAPFPHEVTLSAIREHPLLAGMPLVRKSRLSIQPVSRVEWEVISRLGGLEVLV